MEIENDVLTTIDDIKKEAIFYSILIDDYESYNTNTNSENYIKTIFILIDKLNINTANVFEKIEKEAVQNNDKLIADKYEAFKVMCNLHDENDNINDIVYHYYNPARELITEYIHSLNIVRDNITSKLGFNANEEFKEFFTDSSAN